MAGSTASTIAPDEAACPGCNVSLPSLAGSPHPYIGASAACWEVYSEILAREYGDPRYMAVHRLTVDAYCAQHPGDPERRSIQSVNVHLVGLHLVLDRNADSAFARRVIGAIADLPAGLAWLTPPSDRGRLTVLDVIEARDAEDHGVAVRAWAQGVWSAWTPQHGTIARLADEAIARL